MYILMKELYNNNVETLQAFGALFQIPQYYRKFLYYKTKMLCNYVINIKFLHVHI
jgi:hypothetical protein